MNIVIICQELRTFKKLEVIISKMYFTAEIFQAKSIELSNNIPEIMEPYMIILDIDTSRGIYPKEIKTLRKMNPGTSILIISKLDEKTYAIPYFHAGSNGFISKQASKDDFRRAIDALMIKQNYFSDDIWQIIIRKALQSGTINLNPIMDLSIREKQIMDFLFDGISCHDIALKLDIKKTTVVSYRAKIYQKLSVHSSHEFIERVKILR